MPSGNRMFGVGPTWLRLTTRRIEQEDVIVAKCAKHTMDEPVAVCDDCGDAWCERCLVPKHRPDAPTRCVECALVAAGIRQRPRKVAASIW